MVIVCILLWTLTFILMKKDYKTESTRWLAGITFLTGIGAYLVVFEESLVMYFIDKNGTNNEFVRMYYCIDAIIASGVHYLTPYCMLLYGISYANIVKKDKKKKVYSILFIPIILSYIFMPMESNSYRSSEELKLYFRQLALWSVPYMLTSIYLLVYSYIKEKSYIMKKYKFITTLVIAPCIFYVILFNVIFRAFGIENNFSYYVILIPIQFTGFLFFAYKYGILGVKLKFERYKFAFDDISELVSDSFIVVNEKYKVVEYNELFRDNFLIKEKKYNDIEQVINCSNLFQYKDVIINLINDSKENENKIIEVSIYIKEELKYYEVKANHIMEDAEYYGTVLLFKDITLYKKNVELINQNQFQIIERERLLSLSQLIGGVAHNLKTPLMSSAGGINIIKRDTGKLFEYIQKNCSDNEEITKIINEINDWEQRIIEYLIYMSDVITTVKGQVTEYSEIAENNFSIKEITDKITLLMAFELKKNKCVFSREIDIDYAEKIQGDVNSLVQVLNNLITNSIEVSKAGDTVILGAFKEDDNVIFYVKNFGDEIPLDIKNKIFNKMVTTKGKKGTGLGLYISKSIIKGRFNGEIYFQSNHKETTFFVKIPLIKGVKHE